MLKITDRDLKLKYDSEIIIKDKVLNKSHDYEGDFGGLLGEG